MLEQALVVLAAAGGTAVVQAAGTDAWTGLRQAVARWFGRGDDGRERAESERLEQTAVALLTADDAEVERARLRGEAFWQARIEALLVSLDEAERARAAEDFRALLAPYTPRDGVSAGAGGLAAGGDITIRADRGSIAGGVIHGGARVETPTVPDPSQG
ncbi:hypothetical protein [Streptomyces fructofermentans]|uniref:Uncharacterized protein n=1 Tax=Streptomyces fructofermentans TaxID=152141 RepID=A0A918NRS1_9ACTN|nr:hypothetical protein [Streptomyces fructofermentans]GGX90672.1 hypothetical protein GCM10010515_67260 [Streptomyces fructofermentans]